MNTYLFLLATLIACVHAGPKCPAADAPESQCFDHPEPRALPFCVKGPWAPPPDDVLNPSNTREVCAATCRTAGYAYAGVEYGSACWCGPSWISAEKKKLPSECSAMPCAGDQSEGCGGPWIVSVRRVVVQPAADHSGSTNARTTNGHPYGLRCHTRLSVA